MTLKSPIGRALRADEARQLIRLSRELKMQRVREDAKNYPPSIDPPTKTSKKL
jgi:hypothetical protein